MRYHTIFLLLLTPGLSKSEEYYAPLYLLVQDFQLIMHHSFGSDKVVSETFKIGDLSFSVEYYPEGSSMMCNQNRHVLVGSTHYLSPQGMVIVLGSLCFDGDKFYAHNGSVVKKDVLMSLNGLATQTPTMVHAVYKETITYWYPSYDFWASYDWSRATDLTRGYNVKGVYWVSTRTGNKVLTSKTLVNGWVGPGYWLFMSLTGTSAGLTAFRKLEDQELFPVNDISVKDNKPFKLTVNLLKENVMILNPWQRCGVDAQKIVGVLKFGRDEIYVRCDGSSKVVFEFYASHGDENAYAKFWLQANNIFYYRIENEMALGGGTWSSETYNLEDDDEIEILGGSKTSPVGDSQLVGIKNNIVMYLDFKGDFGRRLEGIMKLIDIECKLFDHPKEFKFLMGVDFGFKFTCVSTNTVDLMGSFDVFNKKGMTHTSYERREYSLIKYRGKFFEVGHVKSTLNPRAVRVVGARFESPHRTYKQLLTQSRRPYFLLNEVFNDIKQLGNDFINSDNNIWVHRSGLSVDKSIILIINGLSPFRERSALIDASVFCGNNSYAELELFEDQLIGHRVVNDDLVLEPLDPNQCLLVNENFSNDIFPPLASPFYVPTLKQYFTVAYFKTILNIATNKLLDICLSNKDDKNPVYSLFFVDTVERRNPVIRGWFNCAQRILFINGSFKVLTRLDGEQIFFNDAVYFLEDGNLVTDKDLSRAYLISMQPVVSVNELSGKTLVNIDSISILFEKWFL